MSISSVSTTDNITSMLVVGCCVLCWEAPASLSFVLMLVTLVYTSHVTRVPCHNKHPHYAIMWAKYLLLLTLRGEWSGCEYFGLSPYMLHSKVVSHSDTVTAQPARPLPYLGLEMMRGIFHLNFTFEILSRHCQVGGHAATPTVLLQATLQKKENH